MSAQTVNDRVEGLLSQAYQLRPNWQDPEKFHLQKSEIIDGLKRLLAETKAVPGGIPQVATKVRAALRELQVEVPDNGDATAPAPDHTADTKGPADTGTPDEATQQADPPQEGPPDMPDDPQDTDATTLDVSGLQARIAEVEQALLELRNLANATAPMPPAPLPAKPLPDPETLYHRRDLATEAGRKVAATLWAHGLDPAEIALVFNFVEKTRSATGQACVLAAVVVFLHEHCVTDQWSVAEDACKDLARQTLRNPAAGTPAPAPAPPAPTPKPTPAPAVTAEYSPEHLRTVEGRAKATELWVQGAQLKEIGYRFGYPVNATYRIWQSINAFMEKDCGLKAAKIKGEARKQLARKALKQFHDKETQ
jgi:hypothetical protein